MPDGGGFNLPIFCPSYGARNGQIFLIYIYEVVISVCLFVFSDHKSGAPWLICLKF